MEMGSGKNDIRMILNKVYMLKYSTLIGNFYRDGSGNGYCKGNGSGSAFSSGFGDNKGHGIGCGDSLISGYGLNGIKTK